MVLIFCLCDNIQYSVNYVGELGIGAGAESVFHFIVISLMGRNVVAQFIVVLLIFM